MTTTILQGHTSALVQALLPHQDTALADWTYAAQIRDRRGALLAEWGPSDVVLEGNLLKLPLPPEVTQTWTWRSGFLGIEATHRTTGQVVRLVQEPVELSREVVRNVD